MKCNVKFSPAEIEDTCDAKRPGYKNTYCNRTKGHAGKHHEHDLLGLCHAQWS
jgi:hypothetical protein